MIQTLTMRDAKKLLRSERARLLETGEKPQSLRKLARSHYGRGAPATGKLARILKK